MSAARRLVLFGGAIAAAACVEIATGPGGVASIRLVAVPPSIIVGDQLRDSNGNVVTLRAFAFAENGDTIKDAEFRFTGLPLPRDTTAAQKVVPLVVDSITGAVRAITPTVATRARIAARLGDRLQVLDTITIVKKPTRLERTTPADSVLSMGFLCSDDTSRAASPVRVAVGTAGTNDSANVGNALPLSVTLTADSTGTLRSPVPSYYVRYEITSPTTIPTVQWRGVTRPALGIIADFSSDRATNTDTTESTGTATAFLRVLPSGLLTGVFAADTFTVRVRASARTTPTTLVPDTVGFQVRLRRIKALPNTGVLTGPGCSR